MMAESSDCLEQDASQEAGTSDRTSHREKKRKTAKKEKRKRQSETVVGRSDEDIAASKAAAPCRTGSQDVETQQTEENCKHDKKQKRVARRAERRELLERVPKTDEHGIAYTKLQLRRMAKRVKRGLPPVPTEQEERERKRQDSLQRKEEEAELAGLWHSRTEEKEDTGREQDGVRQQDEDTDRNDEESDRDNDERGGIKDKVQDEEAPLSSNNEEEEKDAGPTKKAKRTKPVPLDYVCMACQNKHTPAHWIYDCPDKVTVRGTNHLSKKIKGIQNPDGRKVFVSGLPFDTKRKDVLQLFQDCGSIEHCKLLTFEDTGRCKGQAFVTFDSEASARKALRLSGTKIDNSRGGPHDGTNNKKHSSNRMELKLKVSKALNRTMTKKPVM